MNAIVLIRILIGMIFVISGLEKLTSHYQNFLYVLQSYDVIHPPLDDLVARIFPWIEFVLGVFAVLGFFTVWALRGMLFMTSGFLFFLGQALWRNLPIDSCGCFGELIHIPLPMMLLIDSMIWIYTAYLIIRIERSSLFSLDHFLSNDRPDRRPQ